MQQLLVDQISQLENKSPVPVVSDFNLMYFLEALASKNVSESLKLYKKIPRNAYLQSAWNKQNFYLSTETLICTYPHLNTTALNFHSTNIAQIIWQHNMAQKKKKWNIRITQEQNENVCTSNKQFIKKKLY